MYTHTNTEHKERERARARERERERERARAREREREKERERERERERCRNCYGCQSVSYTITPFTITLVRLPSFSKSKTTDRLSMGQNCLHIKSTWAIHSSTRSFARTANPFACSALLALLACTCTHLFAGNAIQLARTGVQGRRLKKRRRK